MFTKSKSLAKIVIFLINNNEIWAFQARCINIKPKL